MSEQDKQCIYHGETTRQDFANINAIVDMRNKEKPNLKSIKEISKHVKGNVNLAGLIESFLPTRISNVAIGQELLNADITFYCYDNSGTFITIDGGLSELINRFPNTLVMVDLYPAKYSDDCIQYKIVTMNKESNRWSTTEHGTMPFNSI